MHAMEREKQMRQTQGNLFGEPEAKPRAIRHYEMARLRKKVSDPHGLPDRQGRYWYERFHEDVKKMQTDARVTFLELILDTPADRVDQIRRMLDRWHRAEIMERDNYAEAMGR